MAEGIELVKEYLPHADTKIITRPEIAIVELLVEKKDFEALQKADELIRVQSERLQFAAVRLRKVLVTNRSYYGVVLTRLCNLKIITPFSPNKTAYTDGKNLFFNPEFMENLGIGNINFVILHEMYHVIFKHCIDRPEETKTDSYYGRLWNYANDYLVNYEIIRDHDALRAFGIDVEPIEGGLVMKDEDNKVVDLRDETSYTLYYKMKEEQKKQQDNQQGSDEQGESGDSQNNEGQSDGDGQGQGDSGDGEGQSQGQQNGNPEDGQDKGSGDGKDQKGQGQGQGTGKGQQGQGPSEVTIEIGDKKCKAKLPGDLGNEQNMGDDIGEPAEDVDVHELSDKIDSTLRRIKSEGYSLSGAGSRIEKVIYDLTVKPKIKWNRFLRRFMQAHITDESSYATPNKRYLWQDRIMPGPGSTEDTIGDITVMIDTSGSIDDESLERFLVEAFAIAQESCTGLTLVLWHTEVYDTIQMADIDEVKDVMSKLVVACGGTDYDCCLKYMADEKYKSSAYVIFTDGYFSHHPVAARAKHKTLIALEDTRDYERSLDQMGKVVNK